MNTPSSSHENTETAGGNTANERARRRCGSGNLSLVPNPGHPAFRAGPAAGVVFGSVPPRRPQRPQGRPRRRRRMKVIRQTRTIEKPVPVPVVEYRDPPPTATPARYLDDHDIAMHVLRNPDLLAKILDSFSAGLGPRLTGRQLTGPLHEAALRLAPRLDDYRRHATPPPPEPAASRADTAGLSRQQRRALDRLQAKNPHR
ncbi:hypothetical protein GS416_11840 [Rhodococcus hoagii]|nr:hypothetical protein [Prescottella equi]